MDPSQYREVLIGLDRALFVFHETRETLTRRDQSLETAILSIRRDVLRTWSGHPVNPYDPALPAPSLSALPPEPAD